MDDSIFVGLTGDVMIGRLVNKAIVLKGYTYPWGDVLPLLRNTDLNIINLETTLTQNTTEVSKTFNFKATPDKVQTLLEAKITAANIANNHILDYASGGLAETIRTLKAAGILYTGAGMTEQEATQPCLITHRNLKIALLGFTDNEPSWRAQGADCGTNYINLASAQDRQRAFTAVQHLREEADLLIVSIHWGPNMREEPTEPFIDFAHQLISQGADIIHGHSAHIFQGIEVYQNKLILYDTGDFIDDYIVNPVLRNDLSFLFLLEIRHTQIHGLTLIPVIINKCQVNQATGDVYQWCLRRMQHLSSKFDTAISDEGTLLIRKEQSI